MGAPAFAGALEVPSDRLARPLEAAVDRSTEGGGLGRIVAARVGERGSDFDRGVLGVEGIRVESFDDKEGLVEGAIGGKSKRMGLREW